MNSINKVNMRYIIISFLLFLIIDKTHGQVSLAQGVFAQEFSKEQAMYQSKHFIFSNVLTIKEDVTKFEIIPLAAATSGELTTLLYRSEQQQKEGMVLCFYGDKWNDSGVIFKGYAFKNLNSTEASEFLSKIDKIIEGNSKYLRDDIDNNNISFKHGDIDVLIYFNGNASLNIRLFWNGFDSAWNITAFNRSKSRFEKNLKK